MKRAIILSLTLLALAALLPAQNAPLTLTAPNGGEVWTIGSTYAITWTQTNLTGNVSLILVGPGHHNPVYIPIAQSVPVADGTYDWTIPAAVSAGTHYRVSVRLLGQGHMQPYDLSDGEFAIEGGTPPPPPPPLPTLTLTAPNGGEEWLAGSTYNVTWTAENFTGNVNLQLMGPGMLMIGQDLPVADGSYSWAIPTTLPVSDHYKVRISAIPVDGVFATDLSDGYFSITGGTPPPPPPPPDSLGVIIVTAPNGGEEWTAGSSYSITWTSTDVTGNVDIALLGGNYHNHHHHHGPAYNLIAEDVPVTDGAYTWTIPATIPSGNNFRVRVYSTGTPGMHAADISDAAFTIIGTTPPPPDSTNQVAVTAPNGGEQWARGSTQEITWTATELTGNVSIFLIRTNDRHIHPRFPIAMAAPNTGSFSWAIPADLPLGDNYKVLIRLIGGIANDLSDAVFSIVEAPAQIKASPNPTPQGTTISFEAKTSDPSSIRIYNVKGQCVRSLMENKDLSGLQSVYWDGNDQSGRKVSAGVYFARVTSGSITHSKRIIILK